MRLITWDSETDEFATVEGPKRFQNWHEAEDAEDLRVGVDRR
jgi:hypothetical protein